MAVIRSKKRRNELRYLLQLIDNQLWSEKYHFDPKYGRCGKRSEDEVNIAYAYRAHTKRCLNEVIRLLELGDIRLYE